MLSNNKSIWIWKFEVFTWSWKRRKPDVSFLITHAGGQKKCVSKDVLHSTELVPAEDKIDDNTELPTVNEFVYSLKYHISNVKNITNIKRLISFSIIILAAVVKVSYYGVRSTTPDKEINKSRTIEEYFLHMLFQTCLMYRVYRPCTRTVMLNW